MALKAVEGVQGTNPKDRSGGRRKDRQVPGSSPGVISRALGAEPGAHPASSWVTLNLALTLLTACNSSSVHHASCWCLLGRAKPCSQSSLCTQALTASLYAESWTTSEQKLARDCVFNRPMPKQHVSADRAPACKNLQPPAWPAPSGWPGLRGWSQEPRATPACRNSSNCELLPKMLESRGSPWNVPAIQPERKHSFLRLIVSVLKSMGLS